MIYTGTAAAATAACPGAGFALQGAWPDDFESRVALRIRAQAEYPEAWRIGVIECAPLDEARVLSLVRVDHPPGVFYATSVFRVEAGRIQAVDEYWATVENAPEWRNALNAGGRERFDTTHDARAGRP